jgi:hypothetical protein
MERFFQGGLEIVGNCGVLVGDIAFPCGILTAGTSPEIMPAWFSGVCIRILQSAFLPA